jgi:hypothetical protein
LGIVAAKRELHDELAVAAGSDDLEVLVWDARQLVVEVAGAWIFSSGAHVDRSRIVRLFAA